MISKWKKCAKKYSIKNFMFEFYDDFKKSVFNLVPEDPTPFPYIRLFGGIINVIY